MAFQFYMKKNFRNQKFINRFLNCTPCPPSLLVHIHLIKRGERVYGIYQSSTSKRVRKD